MDAAYDRALAAAIRIAAFNTATHTLYPGTNLTLRYQVKTRP